MALTKIGSGGIKNVTNAANATFLTIDASEQITVASEGETHHELVVHTEVGVG